MSVYRTIPMCIKHVNYFGQLICRSASGYLCHIYSCCSLYIYYDIDQWNNCSMIFFHFILISFLNFLFPYILPAMEVILVIKCHIVFQQKTAKHDVSIFKQVCFLKIIKIYSVNVSLFLYSFPFP